MIPPASDEIGCVAHHDAGAVRLRLRLDDEEIDTRLTPEAADELARQLAAQLVSAAATARRAQRAGFGDQPLAGADDGATLAAHEVGAHDRVDVGGHMVQVRRGGYSAAPGSVHLLVASRSTHARLAIELDGATVRELATALRSVRGRGSRTLVAQPTSTKLRVHRADGATHLRITTSTQRAEIALDADDLTRLLAAIASVMVAG